MNATAENLSINQTARNAAGAAQAWVLILTMFLPILAILALGLREPENIVFEINGRQDALNALPALHDERWFILGAATLHIQTLIKFVVETSHAVSVELGLCLPYILVGLNAEPLLSSSCVTRTFIL